MNHWNGHGRDAPLKAALPLDTAQGGLLALDDLGRQELMHELVLRAYNLLVAAVVVPDARCNAELFGAT